MQQNFVFYLPLVFFMLFVSVFIINKIIKLEYTNVKYQEVEGFRGYLAFFVFLHHSYIWYFFLRTKEWTEPKSNLFNHFGQTSVAFFFIITAFLFVTKLINSKVIDWDYYIKSRFFRLFPVYITSILIVFIIIAILSKFLLIESFFDVFKDCLSWLFFTVAGPKNINALENTYLINAGVAWSLPYEWMFYFLIPIIGVFFKVQISRKILLIFSLSFIIIALLNHASLKQFFPFIGGIIVAVIFNNYEEKLTIFKKPMYSIVGIALLLFSMNFFSSGKNIFALLIATFIFLLIVSGNSFFGLLVATISNKLGQITYSLYLFHGIVLFVIFKLIIGYETASHYSEIEHWLIIALSIFPIILISQLSFKYIELPIMNYSKKLKS